MRSQRVEEPRSGSPLRYAAAGAADGVATPPAARPSAPRDDTPERIGTPPRSREGEPPRVRVSGRGGGRGAAGVSLHGA
eukprot:6282478-Prymnesium_polylepis.1